MIRMKVLIHAFRVLAVEYQLLKLKKKERERTQNLVEEIKQFKEKNEKQTHTQKKNSSTIKQKKINEERRGLKHAINVFECQRTHTQNTQKKFKYPFFILILYSKSFFFLIMQILHSSSSPLLAYLFFLEKV